MSAHAAVNESVSIQVLTVLTAEHDVALQRFLRQIHASHLYAELVQPLLSSGRLHIAFATTDRPWPVRGIGSKTVHGVCFAVLGANDRAMLTPVITTIEHATNVGLVGAVSRVVLDFLVDLGTKEVGYLVRVNDRAIERALERTGFRQSELRATTEFADYIEYVAAPEEVRARLGLADAKRGDILTLALNLDEFDALCQYHFALSSAIAPFLKDSFEHAALLPGLLDLVAELPIAGVPPGTPGPKTVRVLEPELDR